MYNFVQGDGKIRAHCHVTGKLKGSGLFLIKNLAENHCKQRLQIEIIIFLSFSSTKVHTRLPLSKETCLIYPSERPLKIMKIPS